MLAGNKGEWSEIYALFKLLSDKKLHLGNKNLEQLEDLFFPLIKILRTDSNRLFEFSWDRDLVIIQSQKEEFRISLKSFQEHANFLLDEIKKSSNAAFSIPYTEDFIKSFGCSSLKAKSSVKSDIKIIIHDSITGQNPELGFSIKSQLGRSSTLLNAGKTTNFIYKIVNPKIDDSLKLKINSINSKSKIKDRLLKISENSGGLDFVKTESHTFQNNLTLIDSSLPVILSELVRLFFTSTTSKLQELTERISAQNPLQFDSSAKQPFYSYKVKRFLSDVALGMMPSQVWDGTLDANGGYLIVKDDGELLCYHIYHRNEFEEYLINNTKLETASSSRHDFGNLYEENDELFFKLNLQVRFIK